MKTYFYTILMALSLLYVFGCKATNHNSYASQAAAAQPSTSIPPTLDEQCRKYLREAGEGASEAALYTGIFNGVSKISIPLDESAEIFFTVLWDVLEYSFKVAADRLNLEYGVTPEFKNLVRFYVHLLGEERTGGFTGIHDAQFAVFGNNRLGKLARHLREQNHFVFSLRLAAKLKELSNSRGISLDDLLFVYLVENYPNIFLYDYMLEQGLLRGVQTLGGSFPEDIFLAKTSPSLACNNHVAEVISRPVSWESLGMAHYRGGFGYVGWFHQPVAKFRYNYPVVSSLIPLIGASLDAGDALLTVIEGRDSHGVPTGRGLGSVAFVFYYSLGILDFYAVKAVGTGTAQLSNRVLSRVRGLNPDVRGLKQMQAVVKDEVMRFESTARRFRGSPRQPCRLTAANSIWQWLVPSAYANPLPCVVNLRQTGRLHRDISNLDRIDVIRDVRLGDIMSAPGHRHLRDPNAVQRMAEAIRRGDMARLGNEKMILNIFTDVGSDGSVVVRSVEVVDGNHRFAAGLLSGRWRTVRDIPADMLDVRVNGFRVHGTHSEPRWVPLDVVQHSSLDRSRWFEVPTEWGARGPTAQIPGDIASIDAVIPSQFRGVPMREVLETSIRSLPH